MAEFNPLGSYPVVSNKVRRVIGKRVIVSNPFANAKDLTPVKDVVQRGKSLLPERYHQYYLNVLESAVEQAQRAIEAKGGRNTQRVLDQLETVFSVLAQPIIQLDSNDVSLELKAYLALASNMFRRFVDDKQVAAKLKSSGYLVDLDPMGFFVGSDRSPFTIAPSKEIPLAFVAKPQHYASYMPLHIVDGHEVGGHVLQSAISGYTQEVSNAVRKRLRKIIRTNKHGLKAGDKVRLPRKPYLLQRPYKDVAVSTFISETFANWSSEFFCDVCGVLNLGPAYVNGMILLLSQLGDEKVLSNKSIYTIAQGVSTHPTRLLRVLLCLEVLNELKFDNKEVYLEQLKNRLAIACGGSIPKRVAWVDKSGKELFSFSLDDVFPLIGETACIIKNSKMKSLDGRSLGDILTWGSKDEATVRQLTDELASCHVDENTSIEARHVVAASMFAIEHLSNSEAFEQRVSEINNCALKIMASLFEEQCLLCDRPAYAETRRQDVFRLSSLVSRVEKLVGK